MISLTRHCWHEPRREGDARGFLHGVHRACEASIGSPVQLVIFPVRPPDQREALGTEDLAEGIYDSGGSIGDHDGVGLEFTEPLEVWLVSEGVEEHAYGNVHVVTDALCHRSQRTGGQRKKSAGGVRRGGAQRLHFTRHARKKARTTKANLSKIVSASKLDATQALLPTLYLQPPSIIVAKSVYWTGAWLARRQDLGGCM